MDTGRAGRAVLEISTEGLGSYVADLDKAKKGGKELEKSWQSAGKTAQSFGKDILGVAAGFVTAEAAIAAARVVTRALFGELKTLTLHGAAVADVAENYAHLTSQAGQLGSRLLGTLRAGTHATISDFELMQTVNQDLSAGLRLTDAQFGTLAKGAFALAQATGGDVKDALDAMNDAMLTGRTRALALLTGKINETAAEEKYAKSLGTTVEHLTDEGKLEARRIGILDAATAATARLGDQTDGLDERVAQAQVFWANFENELGRTIATSPVLEAGMLGIKDALQQTFGVDQQHLVAAIAGLIDDLAIGIVDLAKIEVVYLAGAVKGWYALKKVVGDTIQIADGVRLALLYAQQTAALGSADFAGWKKLDDQIGDLLVTMSLRGKALQQDDKAQAGVDATTARYLATLDGLRGKMEAAKVAAAAHAAAITSGAIATTGALAADARRSDLIKVIAADLAEEQKRIDAVASAFNVMAARADAALQATTDALGASLKASQPATLDFGQYTSGVGKGVLQNKGDNLIAPLIAWPKDIASEALDGSMVLGQNIAEAFALMGAQTRGELQRTADATSDAFEVMRASGLATAADLQEAWARSEAARREASEESSSAWRENTAALLDGAEQVFTALGNKYKAAAIAGAIIATYSAISKALASAPWPFNLALAAGAAATGWANVAKIKNAQAGFAEGTPALDFQNFGPRRTVDLHGEEAVVPRRGGPHRLATEIATSLRTRTAVAMPRFSMPQLPVMAIAGGGSRGELHLPTPGGARGSGGRPILIEQHAHFAIQTVDTVTAQQWIRTQVIPQIGEAFSLNRSRLRSIVKRAIED